MSNAIVAVDPRVESDESVLARPPLKSAGGKTRLLPELLQRVPSSFANYHEPFVGGGALYWALAESGRLDGVGRSPYRRIARLSDLNEHLVRTYQAIQEDVGGLVLRLRQMPHDKEYFLALRERDVLAAGVPDVEVAAWFIYLNKCAFNGLFRVNKAGKFNVPWGDYKKPNICDEPTLRACAAVLKRVKTEIERMSFERILDYAKADDFCYLDSPYHPLSKTSNFTSYNGGGFKLEDQERLRDVALELKRRGVHVLLSNSDCPTIRELYTDGFTIEAVEAPRSINSKGDGRGNVSELLIR